jgi:hypothetical protein
VDRVCPEKQLTNTYVANPDIPSRSNRSPSRPHATASTIASMTDFRKIADKLGKRPSEFATPNERNERYIDIEQMIVRYPAVATLCLMAICGVVLFFAVWTVVSLLIVAFNT